MTSLALLQTCFVASQTPYTIQLVGDRVRESINISNIDVQALQVCGLNTGKTYQVWTAKTGCEPTVKLAIGADDFATTFEFLATAPCMDFLLKKDTSTPTCGQGNTWFSMGCNDCAKKTTNPFSKIGTTGGQSGQSLLEDVFIGGDCYDITDFTAIGSSLGRGSFNDGASTIGINSGVILSTGDISFAEGPNNNDGAGINIGGPTADADLELLSGFDVYDVQGIEFDFIPTSNNVSFRYVFASEEYCEYVGQGASDFFGFFISGPGINGGFSSNGENIALVPSSPLFVSIDNISHLTNSAFFVPNRANCGGTTNMTDIQFDGWTTTLTATADLIPCETYHIRLVIADVIDGIFDSAIFLEAGSFSAGGNAVLGDVVVAPNPVVAYESCNDGSFTFTRTGGDINQPIPIELTLLPSSTATLGIDYDAFPLNLTIPAGENSLSLPVNIISDGLTEGTETINLSLANNCKCNNQTLSLEINDPPALQVILPTVEACEGGTVVITATASGGIPGTAYDYLWSNGQTGPSATLSPATAQTISVTVTDDCGENATASTQVQVSPLPTATLTSGSGSICLNNPADQHTMVIELTGTPNWLLRYTINGIAQTPILVTSSPYSFTTNIPGNYEFTGVSTVTGNCPGPASGTAIINIGGLTNAIQTMPVTCSTAGSISISTSGGTSPYSYVWSNGFPDSPSANGLAAGNYTITVTDLNGCSAMASATVDALNTLSTTAVGSQVDCNAPNSGSINLNLNGGSAPFDFNWTNGLPNQQNQTGLPAGSYTVTVTDAGGCTSVASANVTAISATPVSIAQADEILDCENSTVVVSGAGSELGSGINYLWSGPGIVGDNSTMDIQVEAAGTYTLLVTNTITGCTSSTSALVDQDIDAPTVFAEGGEITCTDSIIMLNGIGSSIGPEFGYAWSGAGILSGQNSLTPMVNQGGVFTLTVTNQANGCAASASASVTLDENLPTAIIGTPAMLNCEVAFVVLNGSGSSSGSGISYQWFRNGTTIPNANGTILIVNSPASYQLVVTNSSNGCSSSFTQAVGSDLAAPIGTAQALGDIDCSTFTAPLVCTVQGGQASYSYQWSTTNGSLLGPTNSDSATAATAGIYEVEITDLQNGCTATTSIAVTENTTPPTANVTASGNLDCLTSVSQLNGTSSSQGQNISFVWSTLDGNFSAGQNSLTPSVNAAGTYILTVTNDENGCEALDSILVTMDDVAPSVLIPSSPTLDCGTTQVSLSAIVGNVPPNASVVYAWSTADGQIFGPNDVQTPTVVEPGTYVLQVTNSENGCSNQATVVVNEDIAAPTAIVAQPEQLTCTDTTVALNATGSSSGANFSYEWTTTTGNFITSDTILNPVANEPGVYNLLVTNILNECTASQTVVIEENTLSPIADAGAGLTLTCEDSTLFLNGAGSSIGGDFSYLWTGPGILGNETTTTPSVNQPGIYQLLVTNLVNSCTATATVLVGENTVPPIADAGSGGEISCTISSLSLSGLGSSQGSNFQYEWTSSNGSFVSGQNSLIPIVNAAGDYQITVFDTINGCTASDLVQITPDDDLPPVAIAQALPITCLVDEVELNGTGTASGTEFSYIWTTLDGVIFSGETTLFPTVTEPGTYVLVVTNDLTNCSNMASVTVADLTSLPVAEAGQSGVLTCTETEIELNGNGSATGQGITYLWTTSNGNILSGDDILNPVVNEPGTYLLTVTNNLTGCVSTDQVAVTENISLPIAAANSPQTLDCDTESVSLNGTGSTSGTNISYNWTSLDGNILSGANSLVPVVNEPGTYVLTVTNNATNCSQSTQVNVNEDITNPTALVSSNEQLDCDNTTLALNGSGSSTGSGFGYQWSTVNGNIISGANTLQPTVDEAGNYTLTVTNANNGCTATANIVVLEDVTAPLATVAPPATITCAISEINLMATAALGNNFSFEWTTTNGNILAGDTTISPLVNQAGLYSLTVTNNSNGCQTTVQTAVNQNITAPFADAGQSFLMDCSEAFNQLDGSNSSGAGAIAFEWATTNGALVNGLNTATPSIGGAGVYSLTVTDLANGCTSSDTVVVNMEAPIAMLTITQPPCFGETGSIAFSSTSGGEAPYAYSLDGGANFSSQNVFNDLAPGIYQALVEDANGCQSAEALTIEQPDSLSLILSSIATIQLGDSYQINAQVNVPLSEIVEINWSPETYLSCTDCLNPLATPLATQTYQLNVMTENGCEANGQVLIIVEKSTGVYVPNAFSPNADGINDVFMIYSDPKYPVHIKSFMVFSRWGESVFEYFDFQPNDPAYSWDGVHRGQLMDTAVFVWFAEVEYLDGSTKILKGDVTLVR